VQTASRLRVNRSEGADHTSEKLEGTSSLTRHSSESINDSSDRLAIHMRHILVATDGSSGANRAVDVAAEIAKVVAGNLLIATSVAWIAKVVRWQLTFEFPDVS